MNTVRKQIYDIIEVGKQSNSKLYDMAMMVVIFISMIPLMMKEPPFIVKVLDGICVIIFMIDYCLRFLCADYKLGKGVKSFFIYPFTPMAIIDLLAILPSIIALSNSVRLLKLARLSRGLRILRFFKLFRYSKSIERVIKVIKKQKDSLIAVCLLAIIFIFISALLVFNIEPDTYDSFFDAIYWATVSLTTVGYGDIYPVTVAGRMVTMAASIFGIAVVALPAGIITAGYMDELNKEKELEDPK